MGKGQEWRDKIRAAATKRAETITLPSGMEVLVAKPALAVSMASQRMPDHLIAMLLGRRSMLDTMAEDDTDQVIQEQNDAAAFIRETVIATVLDPRLVINETDNDDEMRFADLSDEDMTFIFVWSRGGVKEAKVPLRNGEVTSADVENFRDGEGGPVAASS